METFMGTLRKIKKGHVETSWKRKKQTWSQETGMHLQGLSDDLEFLEAATWGHEINWHGNIKQRIDVHTSLIHSCWSHFSELNSVPMGKNNLKLSLGKFLWWQTCTKSENGLYWIHSWSPSSIKRDIQQNWHLFSS